MNRSYDLLAVGRSSIDLYSNDIGAPFTEIKSFSAYVGGCPTNIAVGARRLGLRTALLTAVGDDPVGDFVLNFLKKEDLETKFIQKKTGHRTSAVLLGIEPPDKFPLVFYRDNCADTELTKEDAERAPIEESRVLLVTGTGLSREPSRSATFYAAEKSKQAGAKVFLDLDFRLNQWGTPQAYSLAIQSMLPFADVAIGTEEEVKAAAGETTEIHVTDSQVSNPDIKGDVNKASDALFQNGLKVLALKKGAKGSEVRLSGEKPFQVPPFSVKIVNVLGAGDAFAAGFIYGFVKGWNWKKSARMGNACGAIVATRHGCANFMPYEEETLRFVEEQGGF